MSKITQANQGEMVTTLTLTKSQQQELCLAKIEKLADSATCLEISEKLKASGKFEIEKAMQAYSVTKEETQHLFPRTYNEAKDANVASIATLRKYRGQVLQHAFVFNEITKLCDFFAVGRGMNENGITMLSRMICAEFYYLNIADFKFFTYRAVRGDFGKTFDRLDAPTVMLWMKQYCEERMMKAAAQSQGKKNALQNEEIGGIGEMPEQIAEWAKAFQRKHKVIEIENTVQNTKENVSNDDAVQRMLKGEKITKDDDYKKREKKWRDENKHLL